MEKIELTNHEPYEELVRAVLRVPEIGCSVGIEENHVTLYQQALERFYQKKPLFKKFLKGFLNATLKPRGDKRSTIYIEIFEHPKRTYNRALFITAKHDEQNHQLLHAILQFCDQYNVKEVVHLCGNTESEAGETTQMGVAIHPDNLHQLPADMSHFIVKNKQLVQMPAAYKHPNIPSNDPYTSAQRKEAAIKAVALSPHILPALTNYLQVEPSGVAGYKLSFYFDKLDKENLLDVTNAFLSYIEQTTNALDVPLLRAKIVRIDDEHNEKVTTNLYSIQSIDDMKTRILKKIQHANQTSHVYIQYEQHELLILFK